MEIGFIVFSCRNVLNYAFFSQQVKFLVSDGDHVEKGTAVAEIEVCGAYAEIN